MTVREHSNGADRRRPPPSTLGLPSGLQVHLKETTAQLVELLDVLCDQAGENKSVLRLAAQLAQTVRDALARAAVASPQYADEYPPQITATAPDYGDGDYSEATAEQVAAFLRSIRHLEASQRTDAYDRGREVIELIAASAPSSDSSGRPELDLTAAQMADVVYFLDTSEPRDPASWWAEPDEPTTSHVSGYHSVLGCLERSLRRTAETLEAADA